MNEENPLLDCVPIQKPISNNKITNKSGRPTVKNIIKFGPQPTSIIAQMLSETKKKQITDTKVVSISIESDNCLEVEISAEQICSFCSHRSPTLREHKKHLLAHKQFSCDYPNCNFSCKLSSNLIKHKRVHTNDKPYLCEKCCFRSNYVNSLKAHKRTHTAERPFQCEHCAYKCNSSSNLKKHNRHRHPNSSESTCQCAES